MRSFLDEEKHSRKSVGRYKIDIHTNKKFVKFIKKEGNTVYLEEIAFGTDFYQDTQPRTANSKKKCRCYIIDPLTKERVPVQQLETFQKQLNSKKIKKIDLKKLPDSIPSKKRKQISKKSGSSTSPPTAPILASKPPVPAITHPIKDSIDQLKAKTLLPLDLDNAFILEKSRKDFAYSDFPQINGERCYKIIQENDATIDIAYIKKNTKIYERKQRLTGYIPYQMEDPGTQKRFLVSTLTTLEEYNKTLRVYAEDGITLEETLDVAKKKIKHAETSEEKSDYTSPPTVVPHQLFSPISPILASEPLMPMAKKLLLPLNSPNFIESQKYRYLLHLNSYDYKEIDKRINFCHEIIEVIQDEMGRLDKNLLIENESYLRVADYFIGVAKQLQLAAAYLSQSSPSTTPSGLFYQPTTPTSQLLPQPTLTVLRTLPGK